MKVRAGIMTVMFLLFVTFPGGLIYPPVEAKGKPGNLPAYLSYITDQVTREDIISSYVEGNLEEPVTINGSRSRTITEGASVEQLVEQIRMSKYESGATWAGNGAPTILWPVDDFKARISGAFNERRENGFHQGIDIALPIGTPVRAVSNGIFYKGNMGEKTGLGNYVLIVHNNGFVTYYGHLSETANFANGTKIERRTVVGWSGNTGHSTGPHLHFAIKGRDGFINPLSAISLVELGQILSKKES